MHESNSDLVRSYSDQFLIIQRDHLEEENRLWMVGGPILHRICFPLALFGGMLGIAGILYGAFGEASRGEMQITCLVILVATPIWFYVRKNEKRVREAKEEYLAVLQEIARRNL